MKLKRSVTPHFWVNVIDKRMPIPGIIEFSNLRPTGTGETVVYVPYYMPVTNPIWVRPDAAFVEEAMACITTDQPADDRRDLVASHVGRLKHAQPICPPGFLQTIPPVRDVDRGPADRRYLLLLSGGSRHRRKPPTRRGNGARRRAIHRRARLRRDRAVLNRSPPL